MDFVLIEILFKYKRVRTTIPVIVGNGLFAITWTLDKSDDVIAFKVITNQPVGPAAFGYGTFEKWVLEFNQDCFKY